MTPLQLIEVIYDALPSTTEDLTCRDIQEICGGIRLAIEDWRKEQVDNSESKR